MEATAQVTPVKPRESIELRVDNLGSQRDVKSVTDFFQLSGVPNHSVHLAVKNEANHAILRVPGDMAQKILDADGANFGGRPVRISRQVLTGDVDVEMTDANKDVTPQTSTFATIAGNKMSSFEYVEIDATSYNDPYSLPRSADICLVVLRTFGDDPDRNVLGAGRNRMGVHRLESPNIEKYRGVTELKLEASGTPNCFCRSQKRKRVCS